VYLKWRRELPSSEGKSGKEIGVEYQTLVRQIEQIRPKQTLIQGKTKAVEQLMKDRKTVQDRLSQLRSARAAKLLRQLKRLNKRLLGKIKLTLQPEADRTPVIKFIISCKLDGIGEWRIMALCIYFFKLYGCLVTSHKRIFSIVNFLY
jgi:hypothetical protein